MFYIAICDNSELVCEKIEKHTQTMENIGTEVFYSSDSLYSAIIDGKYFDMIFLNVQFDDGMSGIELGKKIQDDLQNEKTKIVYISDSTDHAIKLFASRPMDFLIKPFDEKKTAEAIRKAMALSAIESEHFEFKINQTFFKVMLKDIIYFESSGRNVIINTINGKYKIYDKLCNIENRISKNFIRVHQSYLVNKEYIQRYKYDELTLLHDKIIPISNSYRKDVRYKILNNI